METRKLLLLPCNSWLYDSAGNIDSRIPNGRGLQELVLFIRFRNNTWRTRSGNYLLHGYSRHSRDRDGGRERWKHPPTVSSSQIEPPQTLTSSATSQGCRQRRMHAAGARDKPAATAGNLPRLTNAVGDLGRGEENGGRWGSGW